MGMPANAVKVCDSVGSFIRDSGRLQVLLHHEGCFLAFKVEEELSISRHIGNQCSKHFHKLGVQRQYIASPVLRYGGFDCDRRLSRGQIETSWRETCDFGFPAPIGVCKLRGLRCRRPYQRRIVKPFARAAVDGITTSAPSELSPLANPPLSCST
jgi:hypothetical protein